MIGKIRDVWKIMFNRCRKLFGEDCSENLYQIKEFQALKI